MSAFEDLHLSDAAASALARLGWAADNVLVRDAAAPAARGQNLLFLAPPSPAWAGPLLAGVAARMAPSDQGLLLAPAASVDAWGAETELLWAGAPGRLQVARSESRAARMLKEGRAGLLVASPEMALALVHRSALKLDACRVVLIAWPELLGDEPLSTLMQDLAKDAQRIIISSQPAVAQGVAERYARKAMVTGPLAGVHPAGAAGVTVHAAETPWRHRGDAAAQVIELLDPDRPVVWSVDRSSEAALRQHLPADVAPLVTDPAAIGDATLVLAWDAPTSEQLGTMAQSAQVVLLAPPGTGDWATAVAGRVRPLRLPGFQDEVLARHAARRAEIARAIDEASLDEAVHALAPLFERFHGSRVAAALYHLWSGSRPVAPAAVPAPSATARIWVGVGQRDSATPADLMAALVKEAGVERSKIGKIDVRESFTLVELPAAEAAPIAERLSGVEIRRRRVVARPDRGSERQGARRPGRRRDA